MDKFYRVSNTIFRSARPSLEDLSTLKVAFRFESILNLEDDKKAVEEEEHNIEHHWPFHFIHAPLSGVYLPHRETLDKILDSILVTPKPLLIHCQHGVDRTGIVVAYYRMKIQGWNLEDAWKEARDKGMSRLLWWWKQAIQGGDMSYREDLIAREVDELMGLVKSDVDMEIIRKALLTSLNYIYGLGVGRQNEG